MPVHLDIFVENIERTKAFLADIAKLRLVLFAALSAL
jgi:hypothetical protein